MDRRTGKIVKKIEDQIYNRCTNPSCCEAEVIENFLNESKLSKEEADVMMNEIDDIGKGADISILDNVEEPEEDE